MAVLSAEIAQVYVYYDLDNYYQNYRRYALQTMCGCSSVQHC